MDELQERVELEETVRQKDVKLVEDHLMSNSRLERETAVFQGRNEVSVGYGVPEDRAYAHKADLLCMFYICYLPFVKCE
jgi:hypothetical protein